MNYSNIPQELKDRKQWVLWKLVQKPGAEKPTKIPYQANGEEADSTKPETWASFDAVATASAKGKYSGIGFVFSKDDEYCGIDFDGAIDEGIINKDVLRHIKNINSWTEFSQSGKGFHIICKAKKPGTRCKNTKLNYEIYDSGRYFALTGNVLDVISAGIHHRQDEVNNFYYEIFPEATAEVKPMASTHTIDMSEREIIEKAMNASNGSKFKDLYNGSWQGYYSSQSDADLGLCSMIAFYTQDLYRIDSIFKSSGLYRKKWDRQDYKSNTISKAISGLSDTYNPDKYEAPKVILSSQMDNQEAQIPNVDNVASYLEQWQSETIIRGNSPTISTGLSGLDEKLGGGLYSGLFVLGGSSGLGKTTLLVQWADHLSRSGHDVLFFSLEMSKFELVSRSISRELFKLYSESTAHLNVGHIMNNCVDNYQSQVGQAIQAYKRISENLYIIESGFDTTFKEIRAYIHNHIELRRTTPIIIIDYLQGMNSMDVRYSDKKAVDENVKALKLLSREINTPVILASSLNRDNYYNPIGFEAFKESGNIEFTADCVLGLELSIVKELDSKDSKKQENKVQLQDAMKQEVRKVDIKILKNRRGQANLRQELRYRPANNYFSESNIIYVDTQTKSPFVISGTI